MVDVSHVRLPTRYEDLDRAFRGRLKPIPDLIELVQRAYASMRMSGGIRFLPMFGQSGSGKSCAARELSTHLPNCTVIELSREQMATREGLQRALVDHPRDTLASQLLIAIVDQYEEVVDESLPEASLPRRFVEWLSLLDRGDLRELPTLVVWLTTSREFQAQLADATSRNRRILVSPDFDLTGPAKETWPDIIEETFEFHNGDTPLADYEVLRSDIDEVARGEETLGDAIETVGTLLTEGTSPLQDFSQLQVLMLWPVTDGTRISRVQNFTRAREGYKLDWGAWYRELPREDQNRLPLEAYNRARLYFDMRLIPIAAADLQPLCRNLDNDDEPLHETYLKRFSQTHFYSILTGRWDTEQYSPLRERESARAAQARAWYETVTTRPTAIGKRLARVLRELGQDADYEHEITSTFSRVKADVFVHRQEVESEKSSIIVELKAYNPSNTMPSSIRDAVRVTLKRHAALVGFIERQ